MTKLTLKNFAKETKLFNHRIIASALIILILLVLLIVRLFYLQILQHKYYTTLSNNNQINLVPIAPNRGLIYDRHGVLLAQNVPVFSLDITPSQTRHLKQTIEQLSQIIKITPLDIQAFEHELTEHKQFEPIPLKMQLTPTEVAKFYVEKYRFPGVNIHARMLRYYPYAKATASVIGYVGRITANDLQDINQQNYAASNYIGKTGIEQYYENILHGKTGYQQVEVDAMGRVVRQLKRFAPIPGDNLYLSIDIKLQLAAEKALGNLRGAVVAIQPSSGQILAFVSNPSYNPNLFVQGISQKEYNKLATSPSRPLYNRALRGQYPPGSTIKPMLGAEALSADVITPSYQIFDPGWFKLPNNKHIYYDWLKGGHGWVNVSKAIIVSCDTFFYGLAVKLGIERIDYILHAFGFGRPTGVDLYGEASGLLPTPAWKMKTYGQAWYTGDTVISGIGQGYILATPLQLAEEAATISERGQRLRPNFINAIGLANGDKIYNKTYPKKPIILSDPKIWNIIINAMVGVIRSPIGTHFHFGQPPYPVAGKPGTAEVRPSQYRFVPQNELPVNLRNDSLFIAFAPVNQPQIAIAVVIEHNSNIAATITREVLDYYMLKENHANAVS